MSGERARQRTTFFTATTLDGYIADEHDSLEWLFRQRPREHDEPLAYDDFIAGIGAIAMGRTTYDWVQRHLCETGSGWPYSVPTWVFTRRPIDPPTDRDVRVVAGEVAPVHVELLAAAGGRGVWVVGGGDLAGQFADAGLLDEVIVQIAPVTLGHGRPLLPRRLDLALRQAEPNGDFIAARYDVVGPSAS